MKRVIVEKTLIATLFTTVLIVFSFANRDSKKRMQQLNGIVKTPAVVPPVKMPALWAVTRYFNAKETTN